MPFIFHIDLDAFFTSVEENLNPKLKGKPLVVAGKSRRTVVASANYEARKYGIKSAQPIFLALKKCPSLKIVSHHFNEYVKASNLFHNLIYEKFCKKMESASIDECFLDVSDFVSNYKEAKFYAKKIQNKIKNDLNLDASIGISYNKFLAKTATDINKPFGITIITNEDIKTVLWKLPINRMNGIGISSAKALEKIGIKKIGDLANFDNIIKLQNILGKNAIIHYEHALGNGSSLVNFDSNNPKSVSISETLIEDTKDYSELKNFVINIAKQVYSRLNKINMSGKSIELRLKDNNFINRSKSKILNQYIENEDSLILESINLLDSLWKNYQVRLIGISVGNLKLLNEIKVPVSLFENGFQKNYDFKKIKNNSATTKIINEINNKIGSSILKKASDLRNFKIKKRN